MLFKNVQNIYDDYKFVTKQDLVDIGLDHLEGTNLLKAYMHGYFVDIRLYNKALSSSNPFSFEKYRKEKIKQQIEESRPARLQVKSEVPKINKDIALKFMDMEQNKDAKTKKQPPNLLQDQRFQAMFKDPDFEVDKSTEEYRLLKPLLVQLDKSKLKKLEKQFEVEKPMEQEGGSSDDDLFSEKSEKSEKEDSSDDDNKWTEEVRKEYKKIQKEKKRNRNNRQEEEPTAEPQMFEVKSGEDFRVRGSANKVSKYVFNNFGKI